MVNIDAADTEKSWHLVPCTKPWWHHKGALNSCFYSSASFDEEIDLHVQNWSSPLRKYCVDTASLHQSVISCLWHVTYLINLSIVYNNCSPLNYATEITEEWVEIIKKCEENYYLLFSRHSRLHNGNHGDFSLALGCK